MVASIAILGLAGCSTAPPTVAPPSSPPATASPSPTTTAVPPTSTATSPTAGASPCPVETQTGRLPSDRMVDVRISTADAADLITFVFGPPSSASPPQGPSDGTLEAAEPPYTQAASGLPIEIDGEHVVIVRFVGMSIVDETGTPTYDGTMDFRPDLAALKTVVNYDMFEGHVGWYLGYDGDGCVRLASDATSVTVVIEHPTS